MFAVEEDDSGLGGKMLIKKLLVGVLLWPVLTWADWNAAIEAYRGGNYETAFQEFKTLAEQGHARAQFNLGFMYTAWL